MFPIPTPTPASAIVAIAAPISFAATTIIIMFLFTKVKNYVKNTSIFIKIEKNKKSNDFLFKY